VFWRHVELVSTSHPAEYKHLHVTLNQVQGDVSDIMTHYGHPIKENKKFNIDLHHMVSE